MSFNGYSTGSMPSGSLTKANLMDSAIYENSLQLFRAARRLYS